MEEDVFMGRLSGIGSSERDFMLANGARPCTVDVDGERASGGTP